MYAHGIEVFDGTNDDDIVHAVPHDLELVLFPADYRFLNQHLMDGAQFQRPFKERPIFLYVVCYATACPSESECRPQNNRIADIFNCFESLFDVSDRCALRHIEPDVLHGFLEKLPVFSLLDSMQFRADKLDAILVEDARLRKFNS